MECVGILAISTLIVVILFGIATIQALLYHARFRRRDRKIYRIMVFLVWFGCLLQVTSLCHALYTYTITGFFDDFSSVEVPLTLAIATLLAGIVHPLVQATLTFRMWKFNMHLFVARSCRIVPLSCWSLSAYVLGTSVFLSVMALFSVHDLPSLVEFTASWRGWIVSVLISTAVVDALISSTLCTEFYMHRHESTHRTVLLLDKLIFWTCPTGALTCLTAVAINIIFMLFMESFAWLAMLYILTNLYANTLIVLLNSRWEMDQDDFDDTTTLTTFRVSGSRPHSVRSGSGHARPPARQQLRGNPSRETLNINIIPTRSTSINDYHSSTYSPSGLSSSHPLNPTFSLSEERPHPGSLQSFSEGADHSSSFEMKPLRSPQSARTVTSPRHHVVGRQL